MGFDQWLKRGLLLVLLWSGISSAYASRILIPMDADHQKDHLKAYGMAYWTLSKDVKVQWLLNYRGGSFLLPDAEDIRKECTIRGVSYEVLSDDDAAGILREIGSPAKNQDAVVLEKAPKIVV